MTTLRAVLTVTVETKPDGDYYFDHADFLAHVVPWIEGGLDDRDDIRTVTIIEQPAVVPSAPADRAAIERVRSVLESEAVVGRSALDYRGLITSALMAGEAQQPVCPTPESHNWGCGCPGDRLPLYSDRGVDTPGCDCGHTGMGMRWHDGVGCAWFKRLTEEGRRLLADDPADEAQQPETQAENPARIDGLRPEFTDHASVESIDAQLQRARSQLRRWHLRVEWLISLRQARLEQKERGEWPAAVAQSVEVRQADTAGEQQ